MQYLILKNSRRGLFTLFNIAHVSFFSIAIVLVVITITMALALNESQKDVTVEVVEKLDDLLILAGNNVVNTDISKNEIKVSGTPIKTSSSGSINIASSHIGVSYEIVKDGNYTITHENIYVGNLNNFSYNTLDEAVSDAKKFGLIDINPLVEDQKPQETSAFVYWIINQNFDQRIDSNELAVLALIYADKDRPATGEHVIIQINVEDGFIFRLDREIPNISSKVINFGGIVKDLKD